MWIDGATGPSRHWVARGSLVLFALLLIVPGAYLYGREPGLPVRIELVAMEDPLEIRVGTRLILMVTNTGYAVVEPVFSVFASSAFPIVWKVSSGPDRLSPKSTGVYAIEAPTLETAILPGADVVVRVNHARGRLFATSRPFRASLEKPAPIVNPGFTQWVADTGTGQQKPFGWEVVAIVGRLGRDLEVGPAVVGGRRALALRITHSGTKPEWVGIHVLQRIEDPGAVARLFADGFNVWVYPTYDFATNPAGWPVNVFGIEINADDRLLWIVFSGKGAGWYRLPNQASVVVLRAPVGRWSQHHVDLQALYRRVGWSPPERMTFILLAATTHERPGTFAPAFGEITQGPAQGVRSSR